MSRGRKAGNRGQGSNWCSKAKRARIYKRDGGRCVWCGCKVSIKFASSSCPWKATVDHVIPRAAGGTNDAQNLVTACMRCNRDRRDEPALVYIASRFMDRYPPIARLVLAMSTPLPKAQRKCKTESIATSVA